MDNYTNPFAGLTIPAECVKIYGINQTLPDGHNETTCFQVTYARYPPYSMPLLGIDFVQHPPYVFSCGALHRQCVQ